MKRETDSLIDFTRGIFLAAIAIIMMGLKIIVSRIYKIFEIIINWIWTYPALFFLVAGIMAFFGIIYLDKLDPEFSYHDILVEAHGMLYDILVFGVLLSIYDAIRLRREKKERLTLELETFKFWREEEGVLRKVNLIKRLIGNSRLILDGYYLENAKLDHLNLNKASFIGAFLNGSSLNYSQLKKVFFLNAKLENTSFVGSNLEGVNLRYTILKGANFKNANLTAADLRGVPLFEVNFEDTILENCMVQSEDWINKLDEWGVKTMYDSNLNEKYYLVKELDKKEGNIFYRIKINPSWKEIRNLGMGE